MMDLIILLILTSIFIQFSAFGRLNIRILTYLCFISSNYANPACVLTIRHISTYWTVQYKIKSHCYYGLNIISNRGILFVSLQKNPKSQFACLSTELPYLSLLMTGRLYIIIYCRIFDGLSVSLQSCSAFSKLMTHSF